MNIFEICILIIAGVIALALLKSGNPVNAVVFRLAVAVLIFVGILPTIKQLFDAINNLSLLDNMSREAIAIILKAFAVLCVGSFSADVCRDNGENALAGLAELSSRLVAISLSLPLITSIIAIAGTFFG